MKYHALKERDCEGFRETEWQNGVLKNRLQVALTEMAR